jgi:hypothetical protein
LLKAFAGKCAHEIDPNCDQRTYQAIDDAVYRLRVEIWEMFRARYAAGLFSEAVRAMEPGKKR